MRPFFGIIFVAHAWLSGRAPRSHRGGLWFESRCVHKMKILFFTPAFYPSIGGVEKHVAEIAGILAAKGHTISIVTENKLGRQYNKNHICQSMVESDSEAKNSKEIARSIYIETKFKGKLKLFSFNLGSDNFFKKFKIWLYLWKQREIIKKQDLVCCHDVFVWYLPFRFIFPKKRVFITFHGYETVFPPDRKAILIRKISEILSFGNICVGDFIKKWYGTKPTFVTYGGINIDKTKKLHQEQGSVRLVGTAKIKNQKIKNGKIKILFVGRLEKDTGVSIYLKTLRLLKQRGIKFKFEVVGDGSLKKKMERYGTVHGFVNDVLPFISKCDLVFASSYLSIQDALYCGKKVIAVYDNPLKYDYLSLSPFAKFINVEKDPVRIFKLIENKIGGLSSESEITEGQAWVKKQTWEKVAETYLALWSNKNKV